MRSRGKTYKEIQKILGFDIPKSSLSYWSRTVKMPKFYYDKLEIIKKRNMENCRRLSIAAFKRKKQERTERIRNKYLYLSNYLADKDFALIVLATLYLGEGTKGEHGCITFGNSNAEIIKLFISLLRKCFCLDEKKFRCTVQGRSDMDLRGAEHFWSRVTGVPLKQFYAARIDPRTVGKKSLKIGYKGVCRIDYLSSGVFNELIGIGGILSCCSI